MSSSPAFSIKATLYAVFVIPGAILAVYALVLALSFLRMRISELTQGCTAGAPFAVIKQNSQ